MARIALLDVNVLIALFDPDHIHHDLAHDWFAAQRRHGWATCPLTENGFVRVISHPRYAADPLRTRDAVDYLRRFCDNGRHHFWPDSVSLRDQKVFTPTGGRGHRQVTDIYLLGLAVKMGGALATFERTIPSAAVKQAHADHVIVIEPRS